ncbi:MAG: c-type cytochrome [Bacteroidia bacterium]|nr:c-type cytochrome [Bacteroidia bacterium]
MKKIAILIAGLITLSIFSSCNEEKKLERFTYPRKVLKLEDSRAAEIAEEIRGEVAAEIADGLELSLWASDSLMTDPIAISIDDKGRIFYSKANRLTNSEFDIRGHRDWMTQSISWQSVEDRRKFLRETFAEENEQGKRFLKDLNQDSTLDWRDLTVEKEQIWFVEDSSGDGIADRAQMYIEDFHEEITDLANGVEVFDGKVYIPVGPDFWRTEDIDGDGIADTRESISHGFAVHIGFGAHGMSGAKMGPDGRIWWGIGDIGMNVLDKEGKRWKYPNQGVIVRADPDGSNFEVYSRGLRNTHEFVFDQYGNLISEDNDGDHRGERERLVYLINGSDTGWRTNWQFGKYTDPENNGYKVWMDEGLNIPRWDDQPAYILPCIQNYVNGPTGMVYNPGTALGEEWYNHFFISEFRGTPASSPIHAFTLKPKGASFELDSTRIIASGLLPTGLDFGPDGALYFGDWIDGWTTKYKGRIWKLDVAEGADSEIRKETESLMTANLAERSGAELTNLLQHQDMRIRQKAQFELVKRGNEGFETLVSATEQKEHQLARVHGIWGIAQMARKKASYARALVPLLDDGDDEIIAQAAKLLGDVRYEGANEKLISLLKHQNPRIRFFATEALGRTAEKKAFDPILNMLEENNDEDAWLRHGGIIALSRIENSQGLVDLCNHPSTALRIAAVVALRRMQDPGIVCFLQDKDEFIVTEAARGINDDWSIEAALPALADILNEERFSNEALIRRAINANLRVGKEKNLQNLADYVQRGSASPELRAEALATLGGFARPSVLDRVDGRYRGEVVRDSLPVVNKFKTLYKELFKDEEQAVRIAAIAASAKLGLQEVETMLFDHLEGEETEDVQVASLQALKSLKASRLDEALELALGSKNNAVRSTALSILPESDIEEAKAVDLFSSVLAKGTNQEKMASLAALATYNSEAAIKALEKPLNDLIRGRVARDLRLDVVEAVETQNNPQLMEKLKAYHASKGEGLLAEYEETLYGGNARRGRNVFYRHEQAQCVRCHAVFEFGGNAGPGLADVGKRLSKKQILESMIDPSAAYAPGFGVVTLRLKEGEPVVGVLMKETNRSLTIRVAENDMREVPKNKVAERINVPSSMPAMGNILTKREIRDLVAFLSGLKEAAH